MRKCLLLGLCTAMAVVSCQEPVMQDPVAGDVAAVSPMAGARPGVMRIKVNDQMRDRLESVTAKDGTISVLQAKSSETLFEDLNILSIKRVFPKDPRFVERERISGIDRWYEVTYSEDMTLTKAASEAASYDGVEVVDFIYAQKTAEVTSPFNDPQAGDQWHYQCNSNVGNSRIGSDINLYAAWNEYGIYGDPNVVVAIIDGGIDVNHEDLRQNLWVNEAELNGTPGVDDDGNGYVDDIYGYNFMYTGGLTAHDHGTHVAGTVGAVNNNGKGVCGIAGGDGSANSGIRMMSCQIFDHRNDDSSADSAPAFKYAADNGAIIAQCSFGFNKEIGNYLPPATKDAIDYFIEYAGTDANGNQVGPMKGGVVIFAAGNDNVTEASPASYSEVIAVASIGADYEKAYYSNYGSWVDVTAPGGDAYKYRMVLSTIPGNKYGTMQGTSMACPHVSGIAALIVSAVGGDGFTNENLKEMILESCEASPLYDYNPNYEGKLGVGLVNTANALSYTNTAQPSAPASAEVAEEPVTNEVAFNVTIPHDEEVSTYYIYAYYSEDDFTSVDSETVGCQIFPVSAMEVMDGASDDVRQLKVVDLDFEKEYFFRFTAASIAKIESELSEAVTATTGINRAPVLDINEEDKDFILRTHEERLIKIPVYDPDGHDFNVKITGDPLAFTMQSGNVVIRVRGNSLDLGKYSTNVVATDKYGDSTMVTINYEIIENEAPVILKQYEGLCISGLNQKVRVNMNEYITDPDKEVLTYTIATSPSNIVQIVETAGYFDITSLSYGVTSVYIRATDSSNKYVEMNFDILVRSGSNFVDLYPNPIVKDLYVRTDKAGEYELEVVNSLGGKVFDGKVTASPFEPFMLDMGTQEKGVYYVTVRSSDGDEVKTTMIKQ